MGQSLFITYMDRNPMRILAFQCLKGGFQYRIALSDKRKLPASRHYARNIFEDDVRHLLVCEPAYESDQWYPGVYLQPQRPLKFRLAEALTRNVMPAIAVG